MNPTVVVERISGWVIYLCRSNFFKEMVVGRNVALKCAAAAAVCLGIFVIFGASRAEEKLPQKYTETVADKDGNRFGFEMVLIPGGKFQMGSSENEAGRKADEGPQHEVTLSPFYLCTTETTLELFLAYYEEMVTPRRVEESDNQDVDAMTGPTPVYGDITMGCSKKNPAMGATWLNAVTYCKWLSNKTGKKYRLPTEAEWEYACRAGTTNIFGFGNDPDQLKDFAWYKDNTDAKPNEAAKKKPNAWGLYDMLGNVREWVYDFYSPAAYKEAVEKNQTTNPLGPSDGKVHVARSGAYDSNTKELRCAARAYEEDWWRMNDPQMPKSKWWLPQMDFIGFRVARSIEP